MNNYNSINDETMDSNYVNYHINEGYINSDAHSLEYNNEFNDQSQLPISINDSNDGFNHDDSTKTAVKELFFPLMLSGFGNLMAGIILGK
jgi:hypothetical protein